MEDDSSENSYDNSCSESEDPRVSRRRKLEPASSSDDDSSDNDSSDNDSSDDDSSVDDSSLESGKEQPEEANDDIPISEKIARREEKGSRIREGRKERTSLARQKIRERLGSMKTDSTTSDTPKKSKHAPTEASSKRADNWRRADLNTQGIGVAIKVGYKARDPRVSDGLSGHLNIDQFEKNYSFINDIRGKEIEQLRTRIKVRQIPGRKGQAMRRRLGITKEATTLQDDQDRLKQLIQERADMERGQIERAAKRAVKKKIEQDVADGQRGAYYLKRKEKKKLELEAKFDEIRKRGGDKAVDKAVAKRRKKNKSRDAAKLGLLQG